LIGEDVRRRRIKSNSQRRHLWQSGVRPAHSSSFRLPGSMAPAPRSSHGDNSSSSHIVTSPLDLSGPSLAAGCCTGRRQRSCRASPGRRVSALLPRGGAAQVARLNANCSWPP
jgi:hypothetical protein